MFFPEINGLQFPAHYKGIQLLHLYFLQGLTMDLTLGMEAQALLEEMLQITAQSLVHMEVTEHYQVVKELGKGKYGQVVLVTHRKRGKDSIHQQTLYIDQLAM